MKRGWIMPVIAAVLGISILTYAVVDYVKSPPNHRGISFGPLFIPLGGPGQAAASPPPHPGPTSSPVSPTPPVFSSNGLKRPIAGLLDRGRMPASAFYSVMGGYVVNLSRTNLQPSPG